MESAMDRETILLLLTEINTTWLTNAPEEFPALMGELFHESMVIRGPGFQPMGSGRDACIQSYMEFARQARVTAWNLSDTEVDLFGDTAVATYAWKITYEMNGQEHQETGHDVFVFMRAENRWRAVWRAMLPKGE
jgi:ketosteroid isomerase-like protein